MCGCTEVLSMEGRDGVDRLIIFFNAQSRVGCGWVYKDKANKTVSHTCKVAVCPQRAAVGRE